MHWGRIGASGWLVAVVVSTGNPASGSDVTQIAERPSDVAIRPTQADTNLDMRSPLETWAMRPRTLNERFVRDLGDGCEYVSQLAGTMRPREPEHGKKLYRADLTLAAHLECSGRVQTTAPPYRLRNSKLTAEEMRRTLAEHGRIVATSGPGRTCSYTPSYAIVDERLVTRVVWQTCSTTAPSVGGGPVTPK
jgi:hypothetical protein